MESREEISATERKVEEKDVRIDSLLFGERPFLSFPVMAVLVGSTLDVVFKPLMKLVDKLTPNALPPFPEGNTPEEKAAAEDLNSNYERFKGTGQYPEYLRSKYEKMYSNLDDVFLRDATPIRVDRTLTNNSSILFANNFTSQNSDSNPSNKLKYKS
jgi:hypothetical protein